MSGRASRACRLLLGACVPSRGIRHFHFHRDISSWMRRVIRSIRVNASCDDAGSPSRHIEVCRILRNIACHARRRCFASLVLVQRPFLLLLLISALMSCLIVPCLLFCWASHVMMSLSLSKWNFKWYCLVCAWSYRCWILLWFFICCPFRRCRRW